jgi:hypothetical protein
MSRHVNDRSIDQRIDFQAICDRFSRAAEQGRLHVQGLRNLYI